MSEGIIVFAATAAVIVAALAGSWFYARWSRQSMRRLAEELGMEFVTPNLEGKIPAPLIALAEPILPWSISGNQDGFPVTIKLISKGSGKSRSTYTSVRMGIPARIPGRFSIAKEGFFSKAAKGIFGKEDILTDDAEFDALALVKGDDKEAVRSALASSALKAAIAEAIRAYPSLAMNQDGMVFERSGTMRSADFYRELLRIMGAISKAMSG